MMHLLIEHYQLISVILSFLAQEHITVWEHPPSSSDLTSCDPFLFPELKNFEKGANFDCGAHKEMCDISLKHSEEDLVVLPSSPGWHIKFHVLSWGWGSKCLHSVGAWLYDITSKGYMALFQIAL